MVEEIIETAVIEGIIEIIGVIMVIEEVEIKKTAEVIDKK